MTIVVSDTSPLNYLVLIGEIDVLLQMFDEVVIPPAVFQELQQSGTPPLVAAWAENLPPWVRVQSPRKNELISGLDSGETQAISLAEEIGAAWIFIDEARGRRAAKARRLKTLPLLALLDVADQSGLMDFEVAAAKLRQTSFHMPAEVVASLIEQARRRKG